MNKSVMIESLLSQYQEERTEALRDADERRMEIAKKAPVYADMEGRLRQAIRECLENINDDPQAGRKAIYAMKKEAEEQLLAAGYTKEDLKPRYKCEKCEDTGYVGMPVKEFCDCFKHRLNLMQMKDEDLNIPQNHSFETFDLSVFPAVASNGIDQQRMMRGARNWAQDYAEKFSANERRSVFISGESGLGKTFLLDCIIRRIVERGFSAMKFSAYRLNEIMRSKHFSGIGSDGKFDACLDIDFLAIDDLGSEPMLENITIEYLYVLISERQMRGKPFIITTNLTMAQTTARYTERFTSRIFSRENPVIVLKGQDVRLGK